MAEITDEDLFEREKEKLIAFLKKGFKDMDFDELFRAAISKIRQTTSLNNQEEALLAELGEALIDLFERTGKQPYFKQAKIAPYVSRAAQQDAIIQEYTKLELQVENGSLPEEHKRKQLKELNYLRRREIDNLLNGG